MPDDPESATNDSNEASPPLDSTLYLIQQVRRGDKDALDRLLARHVGPLRRLSERASAPLGARPGRAS